MDTARTPETPQLLESPERVLSTLNRDGSRRWPRPKPEHGAFWQRRRLVAYVLMFVFFAVPYVKLGGHPIFLMDLPHRVFYLLGMTFLPTDTLLFMLLFVSSVIAIFWVTALFGRVWCGWACPQTVYTEFLFRPVEYLIEQGFRGSRAIDKKGGVSSRRIVKLIVYFFLSMFLAHTFLAYFVGVETLAKWVTRSPVHHMTSFVIMAGMTALIFFDFAYFREQTCLVACPYGRLQSVLLDRKSIIVAYDKSRGEPRRKGREREGAGDCVDCNRCVMTCPTGIDIREGLQMECIHCTQCIDACDEVMEIRHRPKGLIRYSNRDAIEGRKSRVLRTRVVLYPLALTLTLSLFGFKLATKADTDITVLRATGAPYIEEQDGSVNNQIVIRITNRDDDARQYRIELQDAPGATLIAPVNPLPVPGGKTVSTTVFVTLPHEGLERGEQLVHFHISDGHHFAESEPYKLVGPAHGREIKTRGEDLDDNVREPVEGAPEGESK